MAVPSRPTPVRKPRRLVVRIGLAALGPLGIVVAATAGTACGASRITECNDLIGIVNGSQKKLEEASSKVDADKADKIAYLRSMSTTMDQVADDLSKAKTSIPELKDFSTKYQKLAKDVAGAARQMGDAVEQNDESKYTVARDTLDKLAEQEGSLVNGVNEFCKGG